MSVSLVMAMKHCMSLIMVLVLVYTSVPSLPYRQGQARRWDQLKIELMKTFVNQARKMIDYSIYQ